MDDANASFDCADGKDPDGGWSTVAGADCNDEDAEAAAASDWYPDCDGDGVAAGVATIACGVMAANDVFACADGNSPVGGWFTVAGTDCDDEDSSGSEVAGWYADCDGDGSARPGETMACGTTGANAVFDCEDGTDPVTWTLAAGVDCRDDDPANPCACGMQDNDGDRSCEPVSSLVTAEGAPTGIMNLELATGTLPVYVDGDFDGGGWVLVGRGREDWSFSESGLGEPANVVAGLGTPSAFAPRYLATEIIQELLDNAGLDLSNVEVRVRRAAAVDGSAYQESIWQPLEAATWTWLVATAPYSIEYEVLPSALGTGTVLAGNTRDIGANDQRRTFTWAWNGHNSITGFSYGSNIKIGTNDPNNFLWQFGSEGHAIPYSEVFVRSRTPVSCLDILTRDPTAADGTYEIDPDGFGGNTPFTVACDMADGGYTVVYAENFSSGDSSGWKDASGVATPVDRTSTCTAVYGGMLGGFGIFGAGASSTQTFDLLGIPHEEVSVALDYVVLDSWDGEEAVVLVEGIEGYRQKFVHSTASANVCGASWRDHGAQPVAVEQTHVRDTVTVQVTSTLNQGPTDESFGVDNVVVRVR